MHDKEQIFNQAQYKKRRSALRQYAPEPEQRFWQAVRGQQLGIKFRRQHGIGHYIVDFYCPQCKLVVELDGDSHYLEDAQEYDAVRDAYIQGLGIRVLRFSNRDVMQNLKGVLQSVINSLNNPTPCQGGNIEYASDPTPTLPFSGEGVETLSNIGNRTSNSSPCQGGEREGVNRHASDPTPTLPFSGEGVETLSNIRNRTSNSSPCQGGGREGVNTIKQEMGYGA